jgi:hypothetical protein
VKWPPAWELVDSKVLQEGLRTDGAVVDLAVDKISVAGHSPNSNEVSAGS